MNEIKRPSPEEHSAQIEAYRQELPAYGIYAGALKRVLEKACKRAVPEVIVQAREKSLASFAEKCVRKWGKTQNPAKDLTDLCGGRVIVHTLEQVKAVRVFIEGNFVPIECDDKAAALGEDKFGYRDVHYLVQLRPERAEAIGFTPEECATIGDRVAELQVRTVVQHAWADILHDRLYKAPLKLSAEAKRTGALLAAIMEEGDRAFDRLADELDVMAANYTAYATRENVDAEIAVQELVLANVDGEAAKSSVALRLARLLGPKGEYGKVVEMLTPFSGADQPRRCEMLLELGYALCRLHRHAPVSTDFTRGRELLEEVEAHCGSPEVGAVPNAPASKSLKARVFSRLAGVWEAMPGQESKALDYYRRALESEPGNPYHLANQLVFEIYCAKTNALLDGMKPQIRAAIALCREHGIADTELPFAYFTAGRLSLLLRDGIAALGWYARGLRHLFEGQSIVPASVIREEQQWIARLHFGSKAPQECDWVTRLIAMAEGFHAGKAETAPSTAAASPRVLIIAGSAATMTSELAALVPSLIKTALGNFTGMVVSGGTNVGIPGCVGDAAEKVRAAGGKGFKLIGYIPKKFPRGVSEDTRYDDFVETDDEDFCPGQVMRMWEDFRVQGIRPDAVHVLAFGGGKITAVELRVALALGASTAPILGTKGEADAILQDEVWRGTPTLLGLPQDAASIRAFVSATPKPLETVRDEGMAQAFHEQYVLNSSHRLPENMRPWDKLPQTYRRASLAQAAYAPEILRGAGFGVRDRGTPGPAAIGSFDGDEFKDAVERMAELEHGRWNIERLREGWRYGRPRDNDLRIHDCLVPWQDLPENIRDYDRDAVRAFPEILVKAGLEIFRK